MPSASHHPQAWHDRSSTFSAAIMATGEVRAPKSATGPAAPKRPRALAKRFEHLRLARLVFFRVDIKAPMARATAAASNLFNVRSRPTLTGQCDQQLSRRNGLAFVSPRQKVTNNRGLSMTTAIALDPYDSMEPVAFNGWWVIGATFLFASSPLFWLGVWEFSPDWLRITIFSAAAMLALGLIVFGLVCSFLDGLDDSVSAMRDVLS